MKAAVLHRFGKVSRYEDFPTPSLGPNDIRIQVKAIALENIDRALARGTHYANRQLMPQLPAIVGTDGIGVREDGRLVGFGGLPRMAQNAPVLQTREGRRCRPQATPLTLS